MAKASLPLAEQPGLTIFSPRAPPPQALTDKKNVAVKEAALATIATLLEQGAGPAVESTFVDCSAGGVFPTLLEGYADKAKTVQYVFACACRPRSHQSLTASAFSLVYRTATASVLQELVQVMNPWATGLILPTLLNQVETAGKWQVKTGSLSLIDKLVKIAPEPCSKLMPDMVPVLAGAIWDTKADVKKAAKASMTNATALVSNKDIEKCVLLPFWLLVSPDADLFLL